MSGTRLVIPSLPGTVSTGALLTAAERFAAVARGPQVDPVAIDGFVPMAERIFLHSEEAPRRALIDAARREARLTALLVEDVFPKVARLLEEGWNTDRLSFVDVTIAATRLQDAVRALGRFVLPPAETRAVMLIVPPWEQHTLPGVFAADRLRRMGAPARLLSGLSVPQLLPLIARTGPAGVLLSVGSHRSAARLRPMIGALRAQVPRPIPIVVGGPAMEADAATCRCSGADMATDDLLAALSFCDFRLGEGADERRGADA